MKGEAALSGDAKWYLGHHRNASVPCEALSFPAISPISQTGNRLTPANCVHSRPGLSVPQQLFSQ